ncbi:MAG: hypothetical protein K1X48_05290 [Burkholderiaceae bacterium]|nr:hypothetical protein [Burkholderiaceae bacterium]
MPIAKQNVSAQQLYSELRQLLIQVRWLKRTCFILLIFNIIAAVVLWILHNPQSFGV